ncbi:MAG TPA: hypothetical protein VF897_24325 [Roseiflexaceae bacterium]
MPVAFFQVRLSVQPTSGGQAELVVPDVLHDLDYRFVIVKDGGEEGIVRLDAPADVIDRVSKDQRCTKLTAKQAEALRGSYPPPRLKQRFRIAPTPSEDASSAVAIEQFAVDDQGSRVVDTTQTVRSGFYLIDVPVAPA